MNILLEKCGEARASELRGAVVWAFHMEFKGAAPVSRGDQLLRQPVGHGGALLIFITTTVICH